LKPRRSRKWLYVAIAVVVVVVIVAIVVTDLGPGPPSIPSGAISYGQAAPGANYSVGSFQKPTAWSLLYVAGLESSVAEPAALALSDLGVSNCSISSGSGSGVPANLTLPAFAGSPTSGHAPLWEFFYQNFSTQAVAVVVVENGAATVLGTISSPECTDIFSIIDPIPAGVLNSPVIGAAVGANASAFLTAHPNASAVYGLIGPVSSFFAGTGIGAKWVVEFSTCALTPNPTGVGAEFNASVNATSGHVFYSQTVPTESCASDPPAAIGPAALGGLVTAYGRSGAALRAA
jgi:hypothetical protein